MKPYSRKELRGIAALGGVCALCVALGFLSRSGMLGNTMPASAEEAAPAASGEVIAPAASAAGTVTKAGFQDAEGDEKAGKKKRKKKRKEKKRKEKSAAPVAARDMLGDTIPSE